MRKLKENLSVGNDLHCLHWSQIMSTLESTRHGLSVALGTISVCCWGVAEIPQIISNYKKKTTEGLSLAFLFTWIIGDLFNLTGCLLEPATIPAQFYVAILYTATTLILAAQAVYYGFFYPCLKAQKAKEQIKQTEEENMINKSEIQSVICENGFEGGNDMNDDGFSATASLSIPTSSPSISQNLYSRKHLCYMSARSLSRSPAPSRGSWLSPRQNSILVRDDYFLEEPFLEKTVPSSTPTSNTRRLFCVVSSVMFLVCSVNLHLSMTSTSKAVPQGMVVRLGRKLLQDNMVKLPKLQLGNSNATGSILGWIMAIIYMGGRLPQICLNIRRRRVEGLNHFMFIFALIGNLTYIGSILMSSLEWSRIQSNLPWLVDAAGCILLDSLILVQFAYYKRLEHVERNNEDVGVQKDPPEFAEN